MAVSHKLVLEWRTPGAEPEAEDTVFRFDVPGVPVPELEPIHKPASEPPEVEELRVRLRFEGARLNGWTRVQALMALVGARAQPTQIRLVRNAGAEDEAAVWTIDSTAYEEVRVERVEGIATDELMPASSWLTQCPLTVVVSAVAKNADARGIVTWRQTVSRTMPRAGLEQIRWDTDVTTKKNVDAREKLRLYGRVLQELLGGTYTYLTQSDDGSGVEITTTDADENLGRVPTRASGVSIVQQWGIVVTGTTTPGASPSEVGYSITTRVVKGEAETEYVISATGPGHREWVESRKPPNADLAYESSVVDHLATRETVGRWLFKGTTAEEPAEQIKRTIRVEITGGYETFDYEIASDGYAPVEFDGGLEPWTVTVKVTIERPGGDGTNAELPLPVNLASIGLRLDRSASVEGEPFVVEHATNEGAGKVRAAKWAREAALVYRSAIKPNARQIRAVIDTSQETVESYYL